MAGVRPNFYRGYIMKFLSARKWHVWLGLGLGWLMLAWFISGAVMIYAHLPRQYKSAEGRLAASGPLQPECIKIDFLTAWEAAGRPSPLSGARLCNLAGRPAYFFKPAKGAALAVWAGTGRPVPPPNRNFALLSASSVPGIMPDALRYLGLVELDQWTVGTGSGAGQRPFYKFAAGHGQGTEIYVSTRTGEVCQVTTAKSRLWSWLGAIPHWLYFTALRRHLGLWRWAIIILAGLGCVLCLTGIWLGGKRFRIFGYAVNRRYGRSPYPGWRGLHHYLGLLFGLPALAFTFSGMMSLHPFDWSTPARPGRAMAEALAGGPIRPASCGLHPASALAAMGPGFGAKMISLVSFAGKPYFLASDGRGSTRLLPAGDEKSRVLTFLPAGELEAAAANLMPGRGIIRQAMLPRGDLYLPKWDRPVLKAVFDDPEETWVYLDPAKGRIIRRLDHTGRANRWLYHFLHCLDLPWLVRHEPLRQALLLFFMAGGALLCFGGILSWATRKRKRRRR